VKPDVVVDVGNSRLKWGLADPDGRAIVASVSLPEDEGDWQNQAELWDLLAPKTWLLASVRPARGERLKVWLEGRGHRVHLIDRPEQLPLKTDLIEPRRAGIDRLLNGVAARQVLSPGEPAVLADAGSAVTVDWLDDSHTFRGGTIFPGLRLMAEALHAYTALLPLVRVEYPIPELPARDTTPAMVAGVFHATAGGIERIASRLASLLPVPPRLFVTGGDAALLAPALAFSPPVVLWPEQTLVGILAAAENWPR
jgi:type III pantothenate kinase